MGRCPACGAWETLVEEVSAPAAALVANERGPGIARLGDVDASGVVRVETGIAELDRVLGGGLVPGSVILLAGEPGVGKSTLALQLAAERQGPGAVLYLTGEESLEQLRLRSERLAKVPADLLVMAETRVEAIRGPWMEHAPGLVVVDSIQTLRTDRAESAPGSVAQVRECAAALSAAAKSQRCALVLVGHVTKDGSVAGPRVLEHLVDVVLGFEGDRAGPFRLLRSSKNRFGSTQEVGVFVMTEHGLEGVPNPSELFLEQRRAGTPGSCIAPIVEGTRPMLVEIQALVAPAGYGTARRTTIGFDDARLALLLAALDRRSAIDVLGSDVYVNVAGGVRISEPGSDLAVALALASSRLDCPLPADAAACGEIGLGGEVRRASRIDLRVREAVRLGFERVLIPAGVELPAALERAANLIRVEDVADAVAWLRASRTVDTAANDS